VNKDSKTIDLSHIKAHGSIKSGKVKRVKKNMEEKSLLIKGPFP
jgi:hypothetical protein